MIISRWVRWDWRWWTPVTFLALAIYPPLLLSGRGKVVADTSGDLYLDPGGVLDRATSMWDPTVGLGTVVESRQGLLWPIAPYYWLMDQLAVPDWVAQRLWLGTLLVIAGAGVVFLGATWRWRPRSAGAAAFVYALSPFVLTLATRSSVALLPYAALGWLLALAVRATRNRGWRHPALFALTVATAGPGDPTAMLLLGLVPVAWVIYAVVSSERVSRTRATSTLAKIGLLTVTVNLWWVAALTVGATNGIHAFRYGEPAELVAAASTAPEVLRGLGFWGFYNGSRLGPSLEAGVSYTQHLWLIGLTFALPSLGLLGLGVVRWRHRPFVIGMVLVATVIAVGAYPWDNPSPVGAGMRALLQTDTGLAVRNLPWIVPAIALGSAIGIGSLVGAISEQTPRGSLAAAAAAAALAYAALPSLWGLDLAPVDARRDESPPDYWLEAAAYLNGRAAEQSGGVDEPYTASRVLELPGFGRASYEWGYTDDPVTPALIDRGYAARQLLPQGSPASAGLLRDLDRRIQEMTLEPEAFVPIARLLGVGDILVRNDPMIDDSGEVSYGGALPFVRNAVGEQQVTFGPDSHGSVALAASPIPDPQPIVNAVPTSSEVFISGDGDGLIDAAAARLIDGTELIRYSASVTDQETFVTENLVDDRAIIITDTNRARAQRWNTIRDNEGYTEQSDSGLLDNDPEDRRLPLFDDREGIASVSEQRGLSVRATSYGGRFTYEPSQRPSRAADGDPSTAWMVGESGRVANQRLELHADSPLTTDSVTLHQSGGSNQNRWISRVELRFDGDDPLRVDLDQSSRTPDGQTIDIGQRTFGTLSIEIIADSVGNRARYDGMDAVGFAEVTIAELTVDELIRMPSDVLDSGGFRTLRYPMAVVQTRQRSATEASGQPEETAIARALQVPTQRDYRVGGRARVSSMASDATRNTVLDARSPEDPGLIDTGCRNDLLTLDDRPVPVRITGDAAAAANGRHLLIEGCGPVSIPGGDHDFRARPGELTGIDLDQLVWCSQSGGAACSGRGPLLPRDAASSLSAAVVSSDNTTVSVEVAGAQRGDPFWLVFGQSHNSGWDLVDTELEHGSAQLVNGYANGFLVTPDSDSFEITIRFIPQNRVEIAFLLSLIAAGAALLLCVTPSRPLYPTPISQTEPLRRIRALTWEGALPTRRDATIVGVVSGAAATVAINPGMGLAVGLLAGFATRREGWRPAFTVLPAALVAATGLYVIAIQYRNEYLPGVEWVQETSRLHPYALVAVVLLGIDVALERVWARYSEYQ